MGRPRKDGKPSVPPVRVGKPRPTPMGGTYRVRAYAPTPGAENGRVTWRHPDTGKQTSSVPQDGQSLDELFEYIEKALDQRVALGPARDDQGQPTRRDMRALGELYLGWLTTLRRDEAYIANRRNLLDKWVYPVIGDTLVADWSVEDSEKVLAGAREASLSPSRVEDLGSTLSGLRQTAHRKRAGGRWLSLDDNPLEGVSYGRNATIQGAHRNYVPKRKRPATGKVRKAINAAGEVEVWDWMPDIISIAAFCAPRLGEQLALRAIDVDLRKKGLDINGVWKVVRKAEQPKYRRDRFRVPHPKNKLRRKTPYLGSQHETLLGRCRKALGLPEDVPEKQVVAAIRAERKRRAALVPSRDWRDYQADVEEEPWLFVDASGLPPTKEAFNEAWHKVRDHCGWDPAIPYKNLRHHAALWWRKQGFAWETIAEWDGHDHRTLQQYYVLPVENATRKARPKLDEL